MVSNSGLQDAANLLRRDVLEMTSNAGSGHPSSCLSCAEIMSVLFFNEMSYDRSYAESLSNDEFVLSKGHAAPILYAALKRADCISYDLNELRKISSPLEGHPIPQLGGWVKAATGSLGQGLGIGAGMALAARLHKRDYRVYVLLGDSECSEGSVWEAVQIASHYNLGNLCAVVDINRLGQRGETMLSHDISAYKKRFESFGWQAIDVDGHSVSELIKAFAKASKSKKPQVILCRTIKGKGVSFLEGKNGWHGRALSREELKKALKEIPEIKMPKIKTSKIKIKSADNHDVEKIFFSKYDLGDEISTREAYGNALVNIADADSQVLVLDAEVSNSTFSEKVKKSSPEQFVECFIAEQNMISMALGASLKGHKPFASTFAAFLARAHDQLRMASISKANIIVCGSHAGVSVGEDGASQMGLEDIALFRSLPNSVIFYPGDAVSAERLTALSYQLPGIKYIRTTRPKTRVIYRNNEEFMLGEFKVVRSSSFDSVVLAGAGITLHECLKAHPILEKQGVKTAVLDIYCIKPFNSKKFVDFVGKHGSKLVIAEDHYQEGGIGDMLISACKNTGIKIVHLAVQKVPHSGTKDELISSCMIGSDAVARAAKDVVRM